MLKRFLTILNILLIITCIYFCLTAFNKITTAKPEDTDYQAQMTVEDKPSAENEIRYPLSYYNAITERNLFNTTDESEQKIDQIDVEALKQTELKVKLWGTVTGNGKKAYAVIEDTRERKQNLYRMGDAVQNATLKIIFREKVVLNVDGRDEILQIEEIKSSKKMELRPPVAHRSQPVRREHNIALKRSQLESAALSVNRLIKQKKIRPHIKNGRTDGISLTGIRQDKILRRMGLRDGDIIMEINGEPVGSAEDAGLLFEKIKADSSINFQITRKGQTKNIKYKIIGD